MYSTVQTTTPYIQYLPDGAAAVVLESPFMHALASYLTSQLLFSRLVLAACGSRSTGRAKDCVRYNSTIMLCELLQVQVQVLVLVYHPIVEDLPF